MYARETGIFPAIVMSTAVRLLIILCPRFRRQNANAILDFFVAGPRYPAERSTPVCSYFKSCKNLQYKIPVKGNPIIARKSKPVKNCVVIVALI